MYKYIEKKMGRRKTQTDEELKETHHKCSEKYRKANMEKYRAYSKAYYEKNKDAVSARRKFLYAKKKELKRLNLINRLNLIKSEIKHIDAVEHKVANLGVSSKGT